MGPGRFSESSNGLEVNEASGKIAVHLVKYWTLLLEILAIAAWICFYNVKPTQDEGRAQGPGPRIDGALPCHVATSCSCRWRRAFLADHRDGHCTGCAASLCLSLGRRDENDAGEGELPLLVPGRGPEGPGGPADGRWLLLMV